METKNKKVYKRIAVAISLFLVAVWAILGTGTSLAWFTDSTPEMNNIFNFAEFELEVSHRLPDGTWEKVDSQTKIFDDEALYEPGYVQVVYLKVDNKGTVPFDFYTVFDTRVRIQHQIRQRPNDTMTEFSPFLFLLFLRHNNPTKYFICC